ncbi:DUF4124 domain-containing protein [Salinivibrio costicola]|uniref:DUF4124 domain-containing protein n=1 Tax=Salinivibrio costicola subsp. alcaliphilus TaxID=272773 RepID=A0ABX3KR48_SALCS|nr:DUF4124 domain-containing protein [Salinivibrio costicola]OOF33522.1 hypothetical protein BZJ21_10305 [Salinivibrio costicola subsp. alcaliphilus]
MLLGAMLLTLAFSSHAGMLYQWTDDNGQVHFSDQPPTHPHHVRPYASLTPSPSLYDASSSSAEQPAPALTPPKSVTLTLVSPNDGATLRSNPGELSVTATVSPLSIPAKQTRLVLDGQPVASPPTISLNASQRQLDWRLAPIDRGTHQIQVQYLESGKVIASSSIYHVYLHRAHVNQRHRRQD